MLYLTCTAVQLVEMVLSGFSGWMMRQAKASSTISNFYPPAYYISLSHLPISILMIKSLYFRFLRINLPAAGHPTAVAFVDDASSVVVASQALQGSSVYMYGEEKPRGEQQSAKLPLPEIKWEHHKVHDKKYIITLIGTKATYGTADGSTIVASCSEGIFRRQV